MPYLDRLDTFKSLNATIRDLHPHVDTEVDLVAQHLEQPSIRALVDAYLNKLRVPRRTADLNYLNELILSHLHRIPYESFSKILDTERHWEYGGPIPPLHFATERIVKQRTGGTCWVLARSFAALLVELGFDASLAHMEPGHLCNKVNIGPDTYYVDVAYGAPLFQAFPITKSFEVVAPSETFQYTSQGDQAIVVRTPGPTKTLSFKTVAMDDVRDAVAFANSWETSRHLRILTASRFVEAGFVRLVWNTFKDWRSGCLQETVLTDSAIAEVLDKVFDLEPDQFFAARELLRNRGITAENYNQPSLP